MSNLIRRGSGLRLPPMPTIRDVIRIFKLQARKQLSQNFITDERLTARIVKAAGHLEQQYVLEVGPGPGSITRSIIRRAPKHLAVVEKDRRFIPTMELLREATQPVMQMDIYRDDILNFPIERAFPDCLPHDWHDAVGPVHLIGNLPFAISTRLLVNWLKDISLRRGAWVYGRTPMTLTFQKEVAERIVAPMMDRQRCRLSVMSQIWTKPQYRFLIQGKAFVPKPDVDVVVVRLDPLKEPLTTLPFDLVEKVMRHIFSMRQRFVRRGIANLYPPEVREDLTNHTFLEAGIDPETRSYQLSNEECVRLANVYSLILAKHPEIDAYNYRARKIRSTSGDDDSELDEDADDIEEDIESDVDASK